MLFSVTEHFMKTARHASFYLASGPETGPLIIFVHGWPELSHSWRHQLRCFGALGFRCVAPDMRGYGRSSHSCLAEPMRRDCADLTVFSGHWMAQERPIEVNAALAKWIAVKMPDAWPTPEALGRA
jgi:pimeloyl-ACP methyl ester carboxylesterase